MVESSDVFDSEQLFSQVSKSINATHAQPVLLQLGGALLHHLLQIAAPLFVLKHLKTRGSYD